MPAPSAATFARLADLIAIPDAASARPAPSSRRSPVRNWRPSRSAPRRTPQDAIARARVAQKEWADASRRERAAIFHRYRDLVLREPRRPDGHGAGRDRQVPRRRAGGGPRHLDDRAPLRARRAEAAAPRSACTGMLPGLTKTVVRYQPKGVVGVISPWNYPMTLAVSDADRRAARRQRRRPQARQPDPVLRAGLRRPAVPGGPAARPVRRRPRAGLRGGHRARREHRVPDVHRLHRHRSAARRAGRPPADRLLRRTRRQEPDDRHRRRQPA